MQLSPRFSAFLALMLAAPAAVPYALASAADHTAPSHFQNTVSLTTDQAISTCEMTNPTLIELSGSYTSHRLYDLPHEIVVDARRATWDSDIRRNSATVRLYGGSSICWIGGRILTHGTHSTADPARYTDKIGFLVSVTRSSGAVKIDSLRISRVTSGIHIRGAVGSIRLNNIEVHDINAGCVIFDSFAVASVRGSFFDGCGRLFVQDQAYSMAGDLSLEGNLIRINVADEDAKQPNLRIGDLLLSEMSATLTQLRLYDNVILIEGDQNAVNNYLSGALFEKIVDCRNNVFIFPGGSQHQLERPECGSSTDDRLVWQNAKDAWMSRHRGDALGVNVESIVSNVVPNALSSEITTGGRPLVSEAGGAPNVIAASRRSMEEAIGQAERTATGVASFLGRWADGSFWHDGTGWLD